MKLCLGGLFCLVVACAAQKGKGGGGGGGGSETTEVPVTTEAPNPTTTEAEASTYIAYVDADGNLQDGNGNDCTERSEVSATIDASTAISLAKYLYENHLCGSPTDTSVAEGEAENSAQQVESIFQTEENYFLFGSNYTLVVTNGIPSHCHSDGEIVDDPTSYWPKEHYRAFLVPSAGTEKTDFASNPMGIVGIAVSGGFFYNHESSSTDCNAAAISEYETFDACDGHSDDSSVYHYHKTPYCIDDYDNCGLMGWLEDGTAVYGQCTLTIEGVEVELKSCYERNTSASGCSTDDYSFNSTVEDCQLDEANGYYFYSEGTTSDGATFPAGTYAYFFTTQYPFIMPGIYTDISYGNFCVLDLSYLDYI